MSDFLSAIDRALDVGDIPAAALIAEQALAAGSTAPLVCNLVAWRREEEGRLDEAEALIRTALAREPGDATLHVGLGVIRRKQGRLKEAVESIEHAIALDAGYAGAWHERGATFEKGGALDDATADYRHAVRLDPNDASARAALASVLARRGHGAEAEEHASKALQLEPGNLLASNALAHIALEQQRFADVVALLEPLVGTVDERREAMIGSLTLLGDALEGMARHEDAYDAYVRAQALFETIHGERLAEGGGGSQAFLDRIAGAIADGGLGKLAAAPVAVGSVPAARHVILTGYPRSGTTLAENILASLPDAVAIEERPTLAMADQELLSQTDGIERLAELGGSELDRLRADYWERAERAAGQSLAGKLFVDMDPFKAPRLPAIARLFPDARVVITRRDPRDVVWSCFHTNFAFNAATMAFTSLERTARHYATSWAIAEAALEALPIARFELRYEDLVRDFDTVTQDLCAFLDVPWSEEVRRFDKTARRRGVTTASASQVRQGLYDGSGGWRRYERQLASVAPILDPWIERFGYA